MVVEPQALGQLLPELGRLILILISVVWIGRRGGGIGMGVGVGGTTIATGRTQGGGGGGGRRRRRGATCHELVPFPAPSHLVAEFSDENLVAPRALQRPLPGPCAAVGADGRHLVPVELWSTMGVGVCVSDVGRLLPLLLGEDGVVQTILVDPHLLQMDGAAQMLEAAGAQLVPLVEEVGGGRVGVRVRRDVVRRLDDLAEGPDDLDDLALAGLGLGVGGP